MRTVTVDIKNNSPVTAYFDATTAGAKSVRNTANFLIRNTMTGIQKSPEERNHNETEVLHKVLTAVHMHNEKARARLVNDMQLYSMSDRTGKISEWLRQQAVKLYRQMYALPYPTPEKWMLSYYQLDAVMKYYEPCYKAIVSHVAQQAVKKTCQSWMGYFKSLADWRKHPEKYKAKPHIPGYIRERSTTAHFTNQVAIPMVVDGMFVLNLAKYGTVKVCPATLIGGKFVKLEVRPRYGGYRLLVTYDDNAKKLTVPENPARMAGIDLGMNNFATVVTNTGMAPFFVDGRWIKSQNQWFNKEKARLTSALTSGSDPTRSEKHSKRLNSLSRRREDMFDDFFYKTAHHIFRKLQTENVEVVVIGHNTDQKQCANMGHKNNQNFVSIPFARFISVMGVVGTKYGIPVIVRDESYTSKASCLDGDGIPTYSAKRDVTGDVFSGNRIKRGMYVSKDGHVLNADVNAAANILRKQYPDAFSGKDMSYLYKTVNKVTVHDILGTRKRDNRVSNNKLHNRKSVASNVRHRERKNRQYELNNVFGKKRKYRYKLAA